MILLKEGQNIVFVSEDTPNITPYVRHYLSAIKVNGLYQFKYHGNSIDVFRSSNFFKDSKGVMFNDTTLDIFILSISEKPYIYPVSQYGMNGNNTQTVISTSSTPVKIDGVTTSSAITEKFLNTDNRSTYEGALTRTFKIHANLSLTSGNNRQIAGYIYKNGVQLSESKAEVTTHGVGKPELMPIQTLVELTYTDFIEVWIENNSDTQNITVTELNVIIQ